MKNKVKKAVKKKQVRKQGQQREDHTGSHKTTEARKQRSPTNDEGKMNGH
jgi:hypothetical protein